MLVPPYDFFGKTDDPGTQGQKLKIEFAIGRDLPARRNVAQTRPIFSHVFQMTMRPRSPETPMIGRRKRREAPTAIVVESLAVRDARDRRVGSRSRPEAHGVSRKALTLAAHSPRKRNPPRPSGRARPFRAGLHAIGWDRSGESALR